MRLFRLLAVLNKDENGPSKVTAAVPLAVSLLFVVLVSFFFYHRSGSEKSERFKIAVAQRGDLVVTISATGTVEPEQVIDVGAQVAGKIDSFGQDAGGKTIDYGSAVEEGTILAKIDPALYTADVAQAEAGLKRAQADLLQMRAKLTQAERDWKRAEAIGPAKALSASAYDNYLAAYEVAKANVLVGESTVAQEEASLSRVKQNLSYCVITSPVKGVIIDRRVNIGQTVVSSLNAPSLFLIAKDLRRMQVWVAVNEADIGSIHEGQEVSFSVDAFPGEVFSGSVGKIRLNASMTQNVVTYTVEVMTDNSTGKLLPYLTANVRFMVKSLHDVLLVPNAALRWSPPPDAIRGESSPAPEMASSKQESAVPDPAAPKRERGFIWVPDGDGVRTIEVALGGTDGVNTEVSGPGAQEGAEVVYGLTSSEPVSASTQNANPFTPQMHRGRGRRG